MGFPARVGLRGFLGYWDLEHMEIFFSPRALSVLHVPVLRCHFLHLSWQQK